MVFKKIKLGWVIIVILAGFIGSFFYYWRTSRSFKIAIITTVAVALQALNSLPVSASENPGSAGLPGAESISLPNQPRSRSTNPSRLFEKGSSKPNASGQSPSGSGSNNYGSFDEQPECKSVDEIGDSFEQFEETINRFKQQSKSKKQSSKTTEWKTDNKYGGFPYQEDKDGNPTLKVETVTKQGTSTSFVTYEQGLNKYYHFDVYNLKPPEGFDREYAELLNYKDRLEYLRKTVPREYVIKYQMAIAKSLTTSNYTRAPGTLGKKEIRGTLYIAESKDPTNPLEQREVVFVDEGTNKWRTSVKYTTRAILKLAGQGFHLFPKAGEKNDKN